MPADDPPVVKTPTKTATKKKRQPVKKKAPAKQAPDINTGGSKLRKLAALMKRANDRAGHKVMAYASDVPNTYGLRRPSGIIQLDIDMAGGAPAGGMIKLTGPENAGKTYLLYLFMAMHQRIYGEKSIIGYGYTEWLPDHWHMRLAGIRVAIPDEMIAEKNKARIQGGYPPFTAEERNELKQETGRVVFIHGEDGEGLLKNIIDGLGKNIFGIIGLDSMSMIMPGKEAAKKIDDDANVRARSQLLTDFQTRVHFTLTRMDEANESTLILIDQVRSNPDKATAKGPYAKFVPSYRQSDIHAAKHGSMMTLMITEGAKMRPKTGPEKGNVLGKQFQWLMQKGSKGTHNNISNDVYYDYEKTIDLQHGIVMAGLACGVIRETNGQLFVHNAAGQPVLENIDGGIEGLSEMLLADFELERDLRQFVLQANGVSCIYD